MIDFKNFKPDEILVYTKKCGCKIASQRTNLGFGWKFISKCKEHE